MASGRPGRILFPGLERWGRQEGRRESPVSCRDCGGAKGQEPVGLGRREAEQQGPFWKSQMLVSCS